MDQDSSLNNTFDFNTQNGVMLLLASIRSSSLSTIEKNELRDLVFLYTNGGGDASVKIALEQKLRLSNIKPVAPAKKPDLVEPSKPELSFGTYRPAPVFKTPAISDKAVSASATATTNNNFVPPSRVEQKNTEVTTTVKVEAPQPDLVSLDNQLSPSQPPIVQPAVVSINVPSVPKPISTPTPAANVAVTPIPPAPTAPKTEPTIPVAQTTNVNYLDRIREIKTAVNSKVGNPVNLVDINNAVGREYMNALLEAMKRLSGGAAGQIDVAMQRLETAYQAVEVAVAEHDKLQKLEAEVEAEVSSVEPVSAFDSAPVTERPVSATTQSKTDSRPVPNPAPVAPATNFSQPTPIPIQNPTSIPVRVPNPPTPPQVRVMAASSIPVTTATVAPTPTPVSGFTSVAQMPAPEVRNIASSVPQATSLAQAPKILTPQDLPDPASLASSVTGDPLYTRDVDNGLEQLLSDWVIFNKSGLFGTGPKGREHPLFKRISDLQIPLLLSGRFEGSTQEIKQSITDYMNGWRYEQGIIYEQGETFEHYLRRVIKHILDLQNKRR